ncbi:MAG: hypothetical protein IJL51_04270 [Oscillospiraceae bacterium]|nr:hypothetical protein [Oscillospiraceae bacterium]
MEKSARRLLTLFFAALLLTTVPVNAWADTGPKPSVTVTLENQGDEICYGTLLSESKGNGPWVVWNGTGSGEYANDEKEAERRARAPYEVWQAFVDYQDEDGFCFLQFAQRVDESGTLDWGYYPPDTFKLLLYYPQTGRFAVSGVLHRYAFHARFRVDLQNGAAGRLQVRRAFTWSAELPSFLFRIALTLAVELGIALLFAIRGKKQLLCISAVNVITQLLLNRILLPVIGPGLSPGVVFLSASLYLPFLELLIFILEALAYCLLLNKNTDRPRKPGIYIVYAFVANAASLVLGLVLSFCLPGMF